MLGRKNSHAIRKVNQLVYLDYTQEETDFMMAMEREQRRKGYLLAPWEILEAAERMGYRKVSKRRKI